jgi:predicted nucleic acid-binding protein
MIHLDTSYLIRAMVPGSTEDRRLRRWLSDNEPVAMSVIAWAEFLCGPVEPGVVRLAATLFSPAESLCSADAARAATLFNLTERRRGSLADCLIAATCLRFDAELATNNPDDFRRYEQAGLRLVQP